MPQFSEQPYSKILFIDPEPLSWLYSLNPKADPDKGLFLEQHEDQILEAYPL